MRRFAAVSAILLPLPFAALPLLAVLFDGHQATSPDALVVADTFFDEPALDAPASFTSTADEQAALAGELGCGGHVSIGG